MILPAFLCTQHQTQNCTHKTKLADIWSYVVSPKRNWTFEIARQWACAAFLRWWCCVGETLSFIFTLSTSRHFN